MKELFTFLISLLAGLYTFSQNMAFDDEVNLVNGLMHHNGSPFSGEFYRYNEQANTECDCTEKSMYKNGKKNGISTTWTIEGYKITSGDYVNGLKSGEHRFYRNSSSNLEKSILYKNGAIVKLNNYSINNKVLEENEYETLNGVNTLTSHKKFYDNGTLEFSKSFKNSLPEGIHILYDKNENIVKETNYSKGKIIEVKRYLNGQLTLVEKQLASGKLEKTNYNNAGLKTREEKYDSAGNLILEGNYVNGKKHGEWKETSTKSVTIYEYNNGELIKEYVIYEKDRASYLQENGYSACYFTPMNGLKRELIMLKIDESTPLIHDRIINILRSRFNLNTKKLSDDILWDKKLEFSNYEITYSDNSFKKEDGTTQANYSASIYATIDLKIRNKAGETEKINFNKTTGNSLLTGVLNTVSNSYSLTKKDALGKSLNQMHLKKWLKTNFLVYSDLSKRERKRISQQN